jgi:hypothetical protein
MSDRYRPRTALLALVPVVALVVVYYGPALFGGMTQAHGDSIFHGLALLKVHQDFLFQWRLPLWLGDIYGGHPLLAEGHIAFFNPLMLLTSALAEPVYGQNLFHVLALCWTAAGVVLICRERGRTPLASAVAALIVTFSSLWLEMQNNITVAGSLAWAPWAFWAMERWVQSMSLKRAALLAFFLAMMIYGGYPQVFHAFIVCAVLAYLPELPRLHRERGWMAGFSALAFSALAVVFLCSLLAAFHLIPLFELTTLSHRSDGVDLVYVPAENSLRGIFYSPPAWGANPDAGYFPVLGYVSALMMGALALCWQLPTRERGYLLALLLLTALGLGSDSPVYRWLLEYKLLPGLGYFRLTYAYLNLAIVCLALLAAFAVDKLTSHPLPLRRALLVIILLGAGLALSHFQAAPSLQVWVFTCMALTVPALLLLHAQRFVLPLMLVLAMTELLFVRWNFIHFVPVSALEEPATATVINERRESGSQRVFEHATAIKMTFVATNSPWHKDGKIVARVLMSLQADSNLLWGISSIQGAHALPLRRREILKQQFVDEIDGVSPLAPGGRFIDYLGVHYVTALEPPAGSDFTQIPVAGDGVSLYQNSRALPQIQLFDAIQWVDTPLQALSTLQSSETKVLVLEGSAEMANKGRKPVRVTASSTAKLVRNSGDDFLIDVQAPHPLWLFLADANYPGWQASLNGVATELHSAQVLGKAVYVPAGSHQLRIFYRPTWLPLATALTGSGIVLFLLALLWPGGRRRNAV